jgi:type II secretory pathway pseudopilin PulG
LIIEIIIAISIVALIALAFTGATALYIRINNLEKNRTTAVNLAQEAMEAVKNFRDGTDWENNGIGGLSLGTNYYPKKSTDTPPKWQLIPGEETIGAFKRKIVFSSVYRSSGSDDISSDDIGILAPDTRKVTVTVTWDQGAKKVEISSYITNWR